MPTMRSKKVVFALVLMALVASGCGSKQAHYYMLSSSPELGSVTAHSDSAEPITVGVGPVTLPDYLLRPEIVTLSSANRVELAEYDRWAEPLDETMERVLAENIAILLPEARVLAYPWVRSGDITHRVAITVSGFEQRPDGKVYLVAVWKVTSDQGETTRSWNAEITAGATPKDYESIVSAMSAAIATLSEKIAGSIGE